MISQLMYDLGSVVDTPQVPDVLISLRPSDVCLESVYTRGDGTLLSRQRLMLAALSNDPNLVNQYMSYKDSRAEIVITVQATLSEELIQLSKKSKRQARVIINYMELHVGDTHTNIISQIPETPIHTINPYVHGIRLCIQEKTSVARVAASLKVAITKVVMQHKVTSPSHPHMLVVQQLPMGFNRYPGTVKHLGAYAQAVQAAIKEVQPLVSSDFMQIRFGLPKKKVRVTSYDKD